MSYRAQVIINGTDGRWRDCAPVFRTAHDAALYITALDEQDDAIAEFRVVEVGLLPTHSWDGTRAVTLKADPIDDLDEPDVPF